jgi:hypothetical protein
MGCFLDPLLLEDTGRTEGGRPVFRLIGPFRYRWGDHPAEVIEVPPGATTDFASVPWPAWWLVTPSTGRKAAVIHDDLCRRRVIPRFLSDAFFRIALRDAGVDPLRRWLMWAFVRTYAILTRRK